MKKLVKWWRRRRFIKAYKTLRNNAERHVSAGHKMSFHAVNEASVHMECYRCPDLQPWAKRKGKSTWG